MGPNSCATPKGAIGSLGPSPLGASAMEPVARNRGSTSLSRRTREPFLHWAPPFPTHCYAYRAGYHAPLVTQKKNLFPALDRRAATIMRTSALLPENRRRRRESKTSPNSPKPKGGGERNKRRARPQAVFLSRKKASATVARETVHTPADTRGDTCSRKSNIPIEGEFSLSRPLPNHRPAFTPS